MITATGIRKDARSHLQGKWGKAAVMILAYILTEILINGLANIVPILGTIVSFIISIPILYGFIISFIKLKRNENVGPFDFLTDGFSNFGRAWGVGFRMLLKIALPVILMFISAVSIFAGAASASIIRTGFNTGVALGRVGEIVMIVAEVWAIIRLLSVALSYNISYDNPNLSAKEVVNESQRLMNGNKGNLFVLNLSFIGWIILATFTLGIGYLWLIPYMQIAKVCFYDTIAGK